MKKKNASVRNELEKLVSKMNRSLDIAVVEGRRDREALEFSGFRNTILACSSLTTDGLLQRISAEGKGKTVAVLTDYDRHGKKLCKEISSYLERRGVKLKSFYRRKLKELLDHRNIKAIESMDSLIKEEDSYGKSKDRKGKKGCEAEA